MPITWRNVGQTVSAGDAARLFEGASDNILGGVDRLTGALRTVKQGRENEFEAGKERSEDALLDIFSQYKTVEDLETAQQSGEVAKLVAAIDGPRDADVFRNAGANRLTELRNQEINTAEHGLRTQELEDSQTLRAVRPQMESISAAIESNDFKRAQAEIEANKDALIGAGKYDDVVGALRVRRNSKEDRAENQQDRATLRQEAAENRLRQEATRNAEDIASVAINSSPYDAAEARQEYIDRVEAHNADPDNKNKISASTRDAELNKLEDTWKKRWGLTDGQMLEHQQTTQIWDSAVQNFAAVEQEKLNQLETEFEGLQEKAWNDPNRITIGQVRGEMQTGLGGDENRIISTDLGDIDAVERWVGEEIDNILGSPRTSVTINNPGQVPRTETIRNERYNPNRQWGAEARRHQGAIMMEVAKRLSGDRGIATLDGIDIRNSNSEIKTIIQDVVGEFQDNTRRKEEILEAKRQSQSTLATLSTTIEQKKRQNLENYKKLNQSLRLRD